MTLKKQANNRFTSCDPRSFLKCSLCIFLVSVVHPIIIVVGYFLAVVALLFPFLSLFVLAVVYWLYEKESKNLIMIDYVESLEYHTMDLEQFIRANNYQEDIFLVG